MHAAVAPTFQFAQPSPCARARARKDYYWNWNTLRVGARNLINQAAGAHYYWSNLEGTLRVRTTMRL